MRKDYCVYTHTDMEGVVRYVGSGTISRAFTLHAKSSRGKPYEDFVTLNGKLSANVIAKSLTKDESLLLELEIYTKNYSDLLLNKRKPSLSKKYPDKIKLESLFKIDETSKSGLRWLVSKPRGISPGDEAGTLSANGYYMVGVDSSILSCHKIIMILLGCDLTDKVIDHINRNKSDNSVANLRVVSQSINMQNRPNLKNNTSNLPCIRFCVYGNKWILQMRVNGKRLTKSFSVNKYGHVIAREFAISAKEEFERLYRNESNSF